MSQVAKNSDTRITLLKLVCWLMVGGFAVWSASFGLQTRQFLTAMDRPQMNAFGCGNSVTDRLDSVVAIGSPAGFAGAIPLGVLWWRGLAKGWSFAFASTLSLACTAALLTFGIWFHRAFLDGTFLSEAVWWLKPFGGWLGI